MSDNQLNSNMTRFSCRFSKNSLESTRDRKVKSILSNPVKMKSNKMLHVITLILSLISIQCLLLFFSTYAIRSESRNLFKWSNINYFIHCFSTSSIDHRKRYSGSNSQSSSKTNSYQQWYYLSIISSTIDEPISHIQQTIINQIHG